MQSFKSFLEQHIELSHEDWTIISGIVKEQDCNKFDRLTSSNQVEDHLYFLHEGMFRLYYEGEEKDTTLNIGFPGDFISSYSSFLTRQPSQYILHALTKCSFVVIKQADLKTIYEQTSCGEQLGRILTEQLFLYFSKRESDFLLKSPRQRYLDLFDEQPHLIQHIPQKYLASYIGITPQALSRIRAQLQ